MSELTEATRNTLSKPAQDLIYLASCAVKNETPDKEKCAEMDLQALYSFAQYHTMLSVTAHALEKVTELPHAFDQAKKKAIRKLSLFEVERIKIFAALEQNGIWYLPLKGIVLKSCYPKASMREMSDNDILCDGSKMDVVKSVMEELGYTCDEYEHDNHDVYSKPPTLEFEMHRLLFSNRRKTKLSDYYADISDRLLKTTANGFERRMSDEDFYIYLLAHMYTHYSNVGTGFRALLDIYVYNRKYRGKMDEDYLSRELEKLELNEFEQMVRTLSHKLFTAQELSADELHELEYFENSGSKGTIENRLYNGMSQNLGGDDSSKSKRKYLLKRIFISGDSLRNQYPTVYKHKSLYPLLFIIRPFKGVITHPKGIITEIKRIKRFKIKEE